MDSFQPTITLIVAVLNGAASLQRCLDSVTSQVYINRQLVVIDGGSTDATVDILHANNDSIDYWESRPDRGIYHAWNKALQHAEGDWVCFLGSDDYLWSADTLQRMSTHLTSARARIVYGQMALVNRHGQVLELMGQPWPQVRRELLLGLNYIPHQGVFHYRSLLAGRRFDETFRIGGDYELLLSELKQADAYFVEDTVVAAHQVGGVASDPLNGLLILKERRLALRKNGLPDFSVPIALLYLKAAARILLIKSLGHAHSGYIADQYRRLTGRHPLWTR